MTDLISRADAIEAVRKEYEDAINIGDNGDAIAYDVGRILSALPSANYITEKPNDAVKASNDVINRADAIEAVAIAICKDYDEIDALKALPSAEAVQGWNNHEVACILAELFADTCACNYNGIDEWLPLVCDLQDSCPNTVGVACWEQFLKHYYKKAFHGMFTESAEAYKAWTGEEMGKTGDEINEMNNEIIKDLLKMMPTAYLLEALGVSTFEELTEPADRPKVIGVDYSPYKIQTTAPSADTVSREVYDIIEPNKIYCSPQLAHNVEVVVRCKDCRFAMVRTKEEMNKPIKPQPILCEWLCIGVENDAYCSHGERRKP